MRKKVVLNLDDIIIPSHFSCSEPSDTKYQNKKRDYINYGEYKLVVNESNVLLDGYISYLILKDLGVDKVDAFKLFSEKDLSKVYVYGVHPNSITNKEYVWRIKNSTLNKIGEIKEGMKLIVSAKDRFAPIIVTRVETLDKPPVEGVIKTVIGIPKYE